MILPDIGPLSPIFYIPLSLGAAVALLIFALSLPKKSSKKMAEIDAQIAVADKKAELARREMEARRLQRELSEMPKGKGRADEVPQEPSGSEQGQEFSSTKDLGRTRPDSPSRIKPIHRVAIGVSSYSVILFFGIRLLDSLLVSHPDAAYFYYFSEWMLVGGGGLVGLVYMLQGVAARGRLREENRLNAKKIIKFIGGSKISTDDIFAIMKAGAELMRVNGQPVEIKLREPEKEKQRVPQIERGI